MAKDVNITSISTHILVIPTFPTNRWFKAKIKYHDVQIPCISRHMLVISTFPAEVVHGKNQVS